MGSEVRHRVELWKLAVGSEEWRCALDAAGDGFRVDILKQEHVVRSRVFARQELARWWAALERAELLN